MPTADFKETQLMAAQNDRTKLPKWAQDELARLDREIANKTQRIASLEDAASPDAGDSDTFIEDFGADDDKQMRPLGRRPRVVFTLADGSRITVLNDGLFLSANLESRSRNTLAVHPKHNDGIHIGPAPQFA